jgi:hypothetical protein
MEAVTADSLHFPLLLRYGLGISQAFEIAACGDHVGVHVEERTQAHACTTIGPINAGLAAHGATDVENLAKFGKVFSGRSDTEVSFLPVAGRLRLINGGERRVPVSGDGWMSRELEYAPAIPREPPMQSRDGRLGMIEGGT